MSEIIYETTGKLAVLTLNRPSVLNAINEQMLSALFEAFDAAVADESINTILFRGAGGKAFGAGGDIRAARLEAMASANRQEDARHSFFSREYGFDRQIHYCKKPVISLMNGITMGGGVGIANACRYTIATEKTVWAMPETAIGFFPDVGSSYYLSRAPEGVGIYLGMTGQRLQSAGDILRCGLASHFTDSTNEEDLIAALAQADDIENCIGRFEGIPAEPALDYVSIAELMAAENVNLVIRNLVEADSVWSRNCLAAIRFGCPTSVVLAHGLIATARDLNYDAVLERDLKIAGVMMQRADFIEGVRAMIVDKDKHPVWSPDCIESVPIDWIADLIH